MQRSGLRQESAGCLMKRVNKAFNFPFCSFPGEASAFGTHHQHITLLDQCIASGDYSISVFTTDQYDQGIVRAVKLFYAFPDTLIVWLDFCFVQYSIRITLIAFPAEDKYVSLL